MTCSLPLFLFQNLTYDNMVPMKCPEFQQIQGMLPLAALLTSAQGGIAADHLR